MKHTLLPIALLLACACITGRASASDDYSFAYATETYTPLADPTVTFQNAQIAGGSYAVVPIGFTFTYWGTPYTTFTYSSHAYCYLGPTPAYGFYPFSSALLGLGDSHVGFDLDESGGVGHRILKVEWQHVGFQVDGTHTDNTTFQLWLREGSNAVEFHFGPSSIAPAHYNALFGSSSGTQVAFSDPGLTSFYNLQGDPAAPTAAYQPGSFIFLDGYPPNGTVYTFTPNSVAGIHPTDQQSAAMLLFPSPAVDELHVTLPEGFPAASRYTVLDESGTRVRGAQYPSKGIDLDGLPAGTYLLRVTDGARSTSKRFIHATR